MKTPKLKTVWAKASEYNRRKDADIHGYVSCVCCGKRDHWKSFDAGHFVPKGRGGKGVYLLPENIFAQCSGCNRPYDSGQAERVKINYTQYMIRRFGDEQVEKLKRLGNQVMHDQDLIHWNKFYTDALKELDERDLV